jgi:hypothetical protein
VKEWYRLHRQDAKDAKNFAKQKSFQAVFQAAER